MIQPACQHPETLTIRSEGQRSSPRARRPTVYHCGQCGQEITALHKARIRNQHARTRYQRETDGLGTSGHDPTRRPIPLTDEQIAKLQAIAEAEQESVAAVATAISASACGHANPEAIRQAKLDTQLLPEHLRDIKRSDYADHYDNY